MKLITRLLAAVTLIIGLSVTRSELDPNQSYTVNGYAFNDTAYQARLLVPAGIEIVTPAVINASQVITAGVTFNWTIAVKPEVHRGSLLPLTMIVNGQSTTINVRVSGSSIYLPMIK